MQVTYGSRAGLSGAGDRPVLLCGAWAETLAHYRRREAEGMDGPKPQFGDVAKMTGEAWEDEEPEAAQALNARMQEIRQQRFAAGEITDWGEAVPWVR